MAFARPTRPAGPSIRRVSRNTSPANSAAGLDEVRAAMVALAKTMPPAELRARAFGLYEVFRPEIPEGVRGWGAAGELDTDKVRSATLAPSPRRGRTKSG
ncbi:MAG: hypothetical protein FJX57_09805 [Alphaproteobacteria bacterium]|nr:hypothetical protein [Alphaproteobacteria bacterium]